MTVSTWSLHIAESENLLRAVISRLVYQKQNIENMSIIISQSLRWHLQVSKIHRYSIYLHKRLRKPQNIINLDAGTNDFSELLLKNYLNKLSE